jgi:hypothetical protein
MLKTMGNLIHTANCYMLQNVRQKKVTWRWGKYGDA